jgi:thiocyanate hydrolase subunit gamma
VTHDWCSPCASQPGKGLRSLCGPVTSLSFVTRAASLASHAVPIHAVACVPMSPSTNSHAHAPEHTTEHSAHRPIHTEDADPDYLRKHVLALQAVLIRKGLITYGEVLQEVHKLEEVDHSPGARVVARAWSDPAYKQRLLANGKEAVAELGITPGGYAELRVLEDTEKLHHVVVCTTCSCVPSPLTGITPDWYKAESYRARVPHEPRAVLREFGLELPEDVEVRVVDTDVNRRCVVLPLKPAGSDGLTEEQLATLVTRDSLFGVGLPAGPVGA